MVEITLGLTNFVVIGSVCFRSDTVVFDDLKPPTSGTAMSIATDVGGMVRYSAHFRAVHLV